MITKNVIINEITLTSSLTYSGIEYPKTGFFKVFDADNKDTLPVMTFVYGEGNMKMVNYLGLWDDFENYVLIDKIKPSKAKKVIVENVVEVDKVHPVGVSEDFALNMLNVALHSQKL